MTDWKDLEPCSFEVDGFPKVFFVAWVFTENGSNRNPRRIRPFRPGWKLDSTGTNGDEFPFEMPFFNDIEEPGVTDQGSPLYPDRLDELVKLFKTTKTGTLNLPWKRGIRCKADDWSRTEKSNGDRNGAILTGTFVSDNEDNMDREAIVQKSPRATLPSKVDQTVFDAESSAIWSPHLADLTQFVDDVVGLISTPFEYASQVDAAAARARRAVSTVRTAFTRDAPGRNQFNDPDSFRLRMRLLEIEDLIAQAAWEAKKRRNATYQHYPERDTDIWSIAVQLKKDANRLIELNQKDFEDLSFIEAGVGVTIYLEE